MPDIKIQHVVSCSSEDTTHKATNLMNTESFRKWKCANPGEKQTSVILQLEKSSTIHSIDIGNDNSAFIEVLVGHSTSDNADDYQVILVTSSFMNPLESRNGTSTNRVRMFGPDKLCKAALGKSWDRVKIVCTQPFNKHCRYGLSFIKLHSPPDETEAESTPAKKAKLGMFKLREEKKAVPLIKAGSFFKERNQEKTPSPLKGAAAVRAASSRAEATSRHPAEATSRHPEEPRGTATTSPSTKLTPPSGREARRNRPASSVPSAHTSDPKQAQKRKLCDDKSSEKSVSKQTPESSKRREVRKPKKEPTDNGRFDELMKGVTFVMSGYQNPYRGELRDKAIKMGARYEGNWGPGCTHLICAFASTPKYQQVLGKGKIVTKEWILDSFQKKSLQPWRRYKLSKSDDASSSSEEEQYERDESSPPPAKKRLSSPRSKELPKLSKTPEKKEGPSVIKQEADEYEGDTDEESISGDKTVMENILDSDADTEDELNQMETKKERAEDGGSLDEGAPKMDVCTEKEMLDVDWEKLPELPDFFHRKHFMFYGKFSADERRQCRRFVVAFGGQEDNYMSDKVDFVITQSKWDSDFDEALEEKQSLIFVRPQWLVECNERGKLVAHAPYNVARD